MSMGLSASSATASSIVSASTIEYPKAGATSALSSETVPSLVTFRPLNSGLPESITSRQHPQSDHGGERVLHSAVGDRRRQLREGPRHVAPPDWPRRRRVKACLSGGIASESEAGEVGHVAAGSDQVTSCEVSEV
jgi:hypothetical protein